MPFNKKVILITGAGGQFGRAGCVHFLEMGVRAVVAVDLSDEGLVGTMRECSKVSGGNAFDSYSEDNTMVHSVGGAEEYDESVLASARERRVLLVKCDVTDYNAVKETVNFAVKVYGAIDLCWNNAGYQGTISPLLSYSPSDFARVMNVNVNGMFHIIQCVARAMSDHSKKIQDYDGGGSQSLPTSRSSHPYAIVNTASVAAIRCTPAMAAYASSKAAVLALTDCAAKDLAPEGIRVNAVSPALIGPGFMWDRQNELHAASGSPYFNRDPKKVALNKIGGVPMKRLGSVDEVLSAVSFLLSEESSYVTGTNLVVDGGMSAGLKA